MDDERVVVLVQEGSVDAFEILVRRYEARIFNYLRRIAGNDADAEDLLQESFVKAYTHLRQFRPGGKFRPWLFQIATNSCRDRLRWWRRRAHVQVSSRTASESIDYIDSAPSPSPDPREKAAEAEASELLMAAIQRLPVKHRTVFVMAKYEGLSYEEIGKILDIPVGTVKSRMNKAVNVLLGQLEVAAK